MAELVWATGLTTCPRIVPTIGTTLASLDRAGFRPRLFIDESTGPIDGDYEMTVRSPRVGGWSNWWLGLAELYFREPRADAFAMFEDDLIIASHTREYVEAIWHTLPAEWGFLNLFVANGRQGDAGRRELQAVMKDRKGIGALALVFPNESVRSLLTNRYVLQHRRTSRGHKNQDGTVRRWSVRSHRPEILHHPSLVQHTGSKIVLDRQGRRRRNSTFAHGAFSAKAQSRSFVGEMFDARELLRESGADV